MTFTSPRFVTMISTLFHEIPASFQFTTTHFMLDSTTIYYLITFGVLGVQSILTRAHRRCSTYRQLVIYSDPESNPLAVTASSPQVFDRRDVKQAPRFQNSNVIGL
jgi:hypothetical protein